MCIGTHDIYNISILSSHNGGVIITGNILGESLTMGALVIVYSLNNDTNTLYKFAPRLSEKRLINSRIMELPIDEYKVSTFIVKENKLPLHRVAALPRFIRVNATIMMAQGINFNTSTAYTVIQSLYYIAYSKSIHIN